MRVVPLLYQTSQSYIVYITSTIYFYTYKRVRESCDRCLGALCPSHPPPYLLYVARPGRGHSAGRVSACSIYLGLCERARARAELLLLLWHRRWMSLAGLLPVRTGHLGLYSLPLSFLFSFSFSLSFCSSNRCGNTDSAVLVK